MRLAYMLAMIAPATWAQLTGHAMISGVVREGTTGDTVRKAIVTLTLDGTPRTWATARTDTSGKFTFANLPAGKYDLRATKNGMGTAIYGATGSNQIGEWLTLDERETRSGLELLFFTISAISGRVYDADGAPVSNVTVVLYRAAHKVGRSGLVPHGGAATDDRGDYRIDNVEPGRYYLLARDDMNNPGPRLATQFYGAARDWQNSTELVIARGQRLTGIDFHLTGQSYPIHGWVTGVPSSSSLSRIPEKDGMDGAVIVHISPDDGARNWSNGVGVGGPEYRFEFAHFAGDRYRLEARSQYRGKVWAASQAIDSRLPLGDVVLALTPATDVNGEVRIEDAQKPAAKITVSLTHSGFANTDEVSTQPGADGKFMLAQVAAAEWQLNVGPLPDGAFVKSVTLGDRDIRFKRFSLGPDTSGPLKIVISTASARVEGAVDSERRAGIVLAPLGPLHDFDDFYYGAVSEARGKFQIAHVIPGKYTVFALDNLQPAGFLNAGAADPLRKFGDEIEVMEGATLQVHPRLVPAEHVK